MADMLWSLVLRSLLGDSEHTWQGRGRGGGEGGEGIEEKKIRGWNGIGKGR